MYRLERTQILDISLEKAWDFFSSPHNLQKITPDTLSFEILEPIPQKMYEGMFISYKISPLPLYTTHWVTEITHIENLSFFVDEQRQGPYKVWHHEHHFKALNQSQVEMTDILHYAMPFGILGKIVHSLFIKKRIEGIFDFRYQYLEQLFNTKS